VSAVTEVRLLIDRGNTRLKWVLARGGEIDQRSAGHGDLDAFRQCFLTQDSIQPDSVMISSVAGRGEVKVLADFCESRWSLRAQVLVSGGEKGGVTNAYPDPEKLGVDRWQAIIGAVKHYGKPVVIWDLGTASTLDAVDNQGRHLGGLIYPGPATMLTSLGQQTQLRPSRESERPSAAPGRSTDACIFNGVFAAQIGALNQFLRQVSSDLGGEPRVVLTGGAAVPMLPLLDFECIHDPWLVFRGMLVA
jgi:type III pantothenate kinase